MDAGANSTQIHDTSSAVEKADLLSVFETFGTANIPEDGQRYIAMHPKGFADLFLITEFASSDFVGDQNLPYAGGMTMKEFLGFKIFSTSAVAAGKECAIIQLLLAWVSTLMFRLKSTMLLRKYLTLQHL